MDTFDNFQYDSASSYGGGIGIVDDTSSVYTSNTQDNGSSVDLTSLSIADFAYSQADSTNGHGHDQGHPVRANLEEDFDAVLDDLKDEGAVDLPPHACRYGVRTLLLCESV